MQLTPAQTNNQLLIRIAEGDEAAFRTLFGMYRKKIYAFALSFTHSEFLAEEVVQDVFMKVWMARKTLGSIVFFESWLRTIARNVALNYLRRIAHEKIILDRMEESAASEADFPDRSVEWKDYHAILERAIQSLPAQQKRVYLMSRRQGMKLYEIAADMQLSIYTVKEYMNKALTSIRVRMAAYAGLLIACLLLAGQYFIGY